MITMRFKTTAAAALAVLALTATATACGKEGSPSTSGSTDKGASGSASTAALPAYTVKTGVDLAGSTTWDRIKKNGKLVVGVKADQPNLGYQDPGSKKYSGFDIEIAKMIAADLGFDESKIEFKTIQSANRETAISGGQVDYYVGTYTINDERKKVCSATGSTSIQRIKDGGYGAQPVEYDSYSLCVQNLASGQVDAVTTDDAILKGYAAQDPANLEVLGKPFSEEPYGVGLLKDDKVMQDAVTNALKNHEDNGDWKKAYDATLGKSGVSAEIPQLES
jgi:glutamate transport system substrate-binding protein